LLCLVIVSLEGLQLLEGLQPCISKLSFKCTRFVRSAHDHGIFFSLLCLKKFGTVTDFDCHRTTSIERLKRVNKHINSIQLMKFQIVMLWWCRPSLKKKTLIKNVIIYFFLKQNRVGRSDCPLSKGVPFQNHPMFLKTILFLV
jgi:hypothetical protein